MGFKIVGLRAFFYFEISTKSHLIMNWKILGLSLTLGSLALLTYLFLPAFSSPEVDFNTEIRPILNKRCMSCHGGVKRSGGLSFITRAEALEAGDTGHPAIVPGLADSSELVFRLQHHDPEMRMPLDGEPLTEGEKNLVEKWIDQGAKWDQHWAYTPLKSPAKSSRQKGMDYWVRKKLREVGLKANSRAESQTLARRLSLDLLGIPPTLSLVQSLEKGFEGDAYEAYVDSLLASPHFGEKWAAMWLDLARYGDSQGYQKDRHRNIWQYRDWVIDAFNQDMPFDRFTIEQIAGDLLPDPSVDQLIATAFHRNTMSNDEGGTDDEEFRVTAVLDRLNTTFEVFQGITISCVQCHGHPYDPFRHKEYYNLMAFFNNTADRDLSNDFPTLRALSSVQKRKQTEIKTWLAAQERAGIDTSTNEGYLNKKMQLAKIHPSRTPIMRELPPEEARVTRVFDRGNWLVHGEVVQPNVPGILPDFPDEFPRNRLGLAQWLVSDENPLTARVIVNRLWEQLFGIGIVETLEDLGSQGAKPANQELLDYLAWEFVHTHNWSVKALLKEIVMSTTYQQSSYMSRRQVEIDPRNRYLGRGPRFRLSAEQIRDQALSVSGLLSPKMYGPSVMPPQPEGVWNVIRHVMRWRTPQNEDRYRRGLYTYWRRSSPYPSMVTFDSPSREFCISRRIRTNTPLQALVTLNDTVYLEAAEGLAKFMWQFPSDNIEDQLAHGYERAVFKAPSKDKLTQLEQVYEEAYDYFQQNPQDSQNLISFASDTPAKYAAFTTVGNVILNLDEFLNKE